MVVDGIRDLVDACVRVAQGGESALFADDDDVILDGFERSIQLDDYSCGAQVTFSILRYFGRARSISRTTDLLGTDDDGTSWAAMRRLFLARGLSAKEMRDARKRDIKAAIDAGAPVVVSVDNEEHWACVFGYRKQRVYLADPSLPRSPRVLVQWSTFMARWDRWAGVVSAPGLRR
jgi:ABC-type bacteriocin/lantibiotic exporter with double-glycine peptidase domain